MTTTAEALSGPWAANLPGWVATTALASLIVVTQEISTPLPDAGWIGLSVVAQLVVSSLWATGVAAVARRRYGRVVPVASAILWVGLGVVRGTVGGIVAAAAGLDPEWAYRIGFWIVVAVCWMPLLTYALARWDEHRRLLAARADLSTAFDAAKVRVAESAEERTARMSRAVDDALRPALDEIRARLRDDTTLDDPSARAIATRLDELARRTADFTAAVPILPPIRTTRRVSVNVAANEFEMRRPVFAALLAAVATAPLVLPQAFRDGGWAALGEFVLAIVVSTAALVGLYAAVRPSVFSGAMRSAVTRVGVLAVGVAGTAVVLAVPGDSLLPQAHILLAVFPAIFWFATAATGTAVALDATSVELETHVEADRAALADLAVTVRATEEESAARVETLVRGEVNGRVAGCALALGMLADGGVPAASRDRVIAGVLAQLDTAAAELRA